MFSYLSFQLLPFTVSVFLVCSGVESIEHCLGLLKILPLDECTDGGNLPVSGQLAETWTIFRFLVNQIYLDLKAWID